MKMTTPAALFVALGLMFLSVAAATQAGCMARDYFTQMTSKKESEVLDLMNNEPEPEIINPVYEQPINEPNTNDFAKSRCPMGGLPSPRCPRRVAVDPTPQAGVDGDAMTVSGGTPPTRPCCRTRDQISR